MQSRICSRRDQNNSLRRPQPAAVSAESVRSVLEVSLQNLERKRDQALCVYLNHHGITSPRPISAHDGASLNSQLQHALSRLVLQHNLSLVDVVSLVRGQTDEDPRPNKALCPVRLRRLLHGYQHCDLICQIASDGISPSWSKQVQRHSQRTDNHQSAIRYATAVTRSIRLGQDAGTYLVLDEAVLQRWPEIHLSPL
ncbi:hypothetical protein PHMEG_00039329, partial [Phytophthora megakarya]